MLKIFKIVHYTKFRELGRSSHLGDEIVLYCSRFVLCLFYAFGSVHRCSILIIVQRDATQSSLKFIEPCIILIIE